MSKQSSRIETTFATYTLGPVLGHGGAGRVLEATDEVGNVWAIKILDPARSTSDRRKRFKNEILFCQRTRHRNLVPIVDHGISTLRGEATPFYVMPKYSGSLRTILKSLSDTMKRLRYFEYILSGVEAAHLANVIHRDITNQSVI